MSEFQNPQQEPGIEKRLILVFVLTFVVIILSQQLLFKKAPQQPAKQDQQQSQQAAAPQPGATVAAAPAQTAAAQSSASKQATSESETVIENDLYRISFTNKGALVRSWILKNYKDDHGKPLELVHQVVAPQFGYPLSLWTWDEQLRAKLNAALYVPSATGTLSAGNELTFEFADGDVTVRKTFKFDHSYVVRMQTSVIRGGNYVTALPAWPGGFGDQTAPASYASSSIDYQVDDKITRLAAKKVSGGATLRERFNWAGTRDQYFAAVFLPQDRDNAAMVTLHSSIDVPKDPAKPDKETIREHVLGAAVGSVSGLTDQRIFVGPMDIDVLGSVHSTGTGGVENGPDLKGVVDFGMWGFIARPLFLWLKWTHNHWVANWGWSIVILTVIINIALLPLRIMSMRSALKMQRIAPQIKAVQEKYKKYSMRDPKRAEMNQEIGALYKQHNVNPAGGCFPLLIQMPFLFAFYKMLAIAIELRQAPWLWVHDLSAPDHMMILPIGIVLSTLFVQKMTPQAGMDPAQQKMFTFMMPVFLGFMSWSLAAGLSLYWTVGNVIAIIQQWVMNRTELGREMRATVEKRERKKQLK